MTSTRPQPRTRRTERPDRHRPPIRIAPSDGDLPTVTPFPHDLEAEESVLGALMLDPAAIDRVADLIRPEDFYRENNGQIFRAALRLRRADPPTEIDNVTLGAELAAMGLIERVGGRARLAMLQEQTPTAANVAHYAQIVRDKATKRELIQAGGEITSFGYDDGLAAEEAVVQAQTRLSSLPTKHTRGEPAGALVPMKTFPFEALPPQLCNLALAAGQAFGYPPEFVAVPGLSALAVAVGGSHVLQVMPKWITKPIVWTVVIAPPGSGKTPAQNLVLEPLVALEGEWMAAWTDEQAQHEADVAALQKGEAPPPAPIRRRCRVSDATLAALSRVLAENPNNGLAWAANEVAQIVGGLDQFKRGGSGSDRPRFLELWDGSPWPLDRIERGSTLIGRPLVSVVGGLQPDRIEVLGGDDGLGARFLRTYHPNAGMAMASPETPLAEGLFEDWDRLIRALVAEQPDAHTPPRLLTMRPDAQRLWAAFQKELAGLYGDDVTTAFGQEVIAKGTEQLQRQALILHCAAHAGAIPQMIPPDVVQAAAELVRYFVYQALACRTEEPSAAADRQTRELDTGVAKLLRWMQRRPDRWATARDIKRATIAGLKTPAEVDRVLDRYAEIYPGCVVAARAPGASRGAVGRVVYLPGHQPSDDSDARHGRGGSLDAGPIVGIVDIVGGGIRANSPAETSRTQGPNSGAALGSDVGVQGADTSDKTDGFATAPTGTPAYDAAGQAGSVNGDLEPTGAEVWEEHL